MLGELMALGLSGSVADESIPLSIAEVCRVQPAFVAGAPAVGRMTTRDLTLIIELELEEEWHTYWWEQDLGVSPRIQIMLLRAGRLAPPFCPHQNAFRPILDRCTATQVGPIPSAAATTRCFTSRVDVPVGLVGVQRGVPVGHAIQHIECASPVAHWEALDLQQDANHLAPARRLRSKLSVKRSGWNTLRVCRAAQTSFSAA